MTIEADIYTALGSLVSNRVYPLTFRLRSGQLPTWPAIRYTFISDVPTNSLDGTGNEDTDDIRVQIDVVDKTYVAMRALQSSVRTAMDSFYPPALLQDGGEDYDDETQTYRGRLDFVIYRSTLSGSP